MSDVDWGSDHLEPPKKRKIPLWVLGCGGGCMFFIGAAIVAGIFVGPKVGQWIEDLSQPDVQWPRLAEVLPFDERPIDVTIERWPLPVFDIWRLESKSQDLFVFVFAPPAADNGGAWGQWLIDPKQAPMFAAQKGKFESTEGSLFVQGRELPSVRFTRTDLPPALDPASQPVEPTPPTDLDPQSERIKELLSSESIRGSGLDLDVTPEGSPRRVLVWLVRGTAGETVSDDEARAFLAPFKIGPQH